MLVWCVLFSVFHFSAAYYKNNVCRSFPDYALIRTSRNCWHNPDINTSPALIARRYGYPLEKYKVTTEDGYILALHRIPHNNTDPNSKRQPVLIQHGIGARAMFWMLLGENSLATSLRLAKESFQGLLLVSWNLLKMTKCYCDPAAFFLVDNGYDVWLSTARGGGYSTQHKNLTTKDPLYWNYSFHDIAIYDLPAIIEFITKTTNQKGNIIYVGHSMGTTESYIYSTIKKDHADAHLKALISLSPVAFMQTVSPFYKVLQPVFQLFTKTLIKNGIYAIGHLDSLRLLLYSFCGFYPTIIPCTVLTAIGTGLATDQVSPEILPIFARHFPAAISVKTFDHFLQMIGSGGRFQHFDYGLRNLEVYNSSVPPVYDVRKISLPVFLFIGKHDAIAPPEDVEILYKRLNRPIGSTTATKYYVDFAHNDFFLGKNLRDFYTKLLDVMLNKIGNK